MRIPTLLILMLVMLSYGCLREELPVAPFDRGDAIAAQVIMQPNYDDQVWYDLSSQTVVATTARASWDLGFSCADSNHAIILNTSCAMLAAHIEGLSFEEVSASTPVEFFPDHPTGVYDSLGLREVHTGDVFVIDMGYNAAGNLRGKRKFQLLETTPTSYTFRYAKLDGTEEQQHTLEKDDTYNYLTFSFVTNQVVQTEPPKDSYDLCFTTYTHLFYDPYLPYLVNGVLLNPYQTYAVQDTSELSFEEMDRETAIALPLGTNRDAIGYAWKNYSLSEGTFTVFPEQVYLIQDSDGFLYKLHFLDFYDESGQKGAPLFGYQLL